MEAAGRGKAGAGLASSSGGAERGLGGMDKAATSGGRFRQTILPNRVEKVRGC